MRPISPCLSGWITIFLPCTLSKLSKKTRIRWSTDRPHHPLTNIPTISDYDSLARARSRFHCSLFSTHNSINVIAESQASQPPLDTILYFSGGGGQVHIYYTQRLVRNTAIQSNVMRDVRWWWGVFVVRVDSDDDGDIVNQLENKDISP